ncbi:hypothetical protein DPMN_123352 [Dreissena polymorpha]|uniref:Uncharacterized protein n=1 Tax=Dreissena polymorpha TaxID=45954 RepID=A0A9D4GRE9_DREPO|nr:hypothetical protein DPMN_123352 [Dreissena polymorpha]
MLGSGIRLTTLARRDRGERELLRSVTPELDVFRTAGIAVFSKMQRTCHPLSIRDGDSGTARPPVWRKYGADQNRLLSWGGNEACLELRGGGLIEGPRDSGTQYAQRTGETVSGIKTTAGDSESGNKGRAACLHSFGGAAYRQEFVIEWSTTNAH